MCQAQGFYFTIKFQNKGFVELSYYIDKSKQMNL